MRVLTSFFAEWVYNRVVLPRLKRDLPNELLRTPMFFGPRSRAHIALDVELNNTLFNLSSGEIYIGKGVIFGHNVCLLTGTHPYAPNTTDRHASPNSGQNIHIGDHTWLASNCIILGSVNIGQHAVVCAGAVVTRDVPNWTMVAGVPAKVIQTLAPQTHE